jgi:hypothetical protein
MRIVENLRDIAIHSNVEIYLRERGKVIETRDGHNVFTITGRNLLSKLISWSTISSTDIPFTNRRVRWVGLGRGSQLEVTTVVGLNDPVLAASPDKYLVPVSLVEFPTSTSVRFVKEFLTSEVNLVGAPVTIMEAGLFADVNPGTNNSVEDVGYSGPSTTTMNPAVGTNPLIAYKAFDGITKTVDFTLEIRWEFRF